MRALTWQGDEHVEVTDVPDPVIQEPNDIIIRVTSTAICGSDLHLYGVLGPFLKPGDVLGHEPVGIVEETGPDITRLRAGDRRAALDRLDALHTAVKAVRRGGTVSVSGVYGGEADPMPLMEMFDRGVQLRMGQAHVRRWIDDLLPIVSDDRDPLGVRQFATHHLPLEDAPHGYEIFRDKTDGCIKVVLQP
jgi:threonine dehydrogenase-like Zn-dependent dehydrogenase